MSGTHLASLWFDFHSDILFDKESLILEDPGLTDNVRNVALWHHDARQLEQVVNFQKLLKTYPKCQKIIFVWGSAQMDPYGDVKFYPIHEDEPIESYPPFNSNENWGGVKTLINRAWHEKNFLKRCKLTENQLPIIEAAECTFVEKDLDTRYETAMRHKSNVLG
jgi:hypothetical protein